MSVELRPLNVKCNIQCHYCYQNPQRDGDPGGRSYDMARMKAAVEAEGGPFTLFGGEPLLVPIEDLEELWRWGLERFGTNAIQTNGTLITEAHLALFAKYKVNVGISVDGPAELNDARWTGSRQATRDSTQRTMAAIARLCDAGRPPALIITLHRMNAVGERLQALVTWVKDLARIGVRAINLHLLESESEQIRSTYGLSTDENVKALLAFLDVEKACPDLKFELFPGMRRLLVGDDRHTTCVWWACDPYTTSAVRGVEGHGQRSNCGRTNKDGIDFVKASQPGYERYIALYHTPQENGGCRDCRFFMMCKGQCPGTAINGDWRNRSEHCDVWKVLYGVLEAELLAAGRMPLSLRPERAAVEAVALGRWAAGRPVSMAGVVEDLNRPDVQAVS